MTEKELKKLNRYQLLEIIIMQTEELQKVTKELEQAKALLEKQQIKAVRAGSIAQASLSLAGVFEAAQSAADIYLESVKEYAAHAEDIIANAQAEAQQIIASAKHTAVQQILDEAKQEAIQRKQAEEAKVAETATETDPQDVTDQQATE